MYYKIKSIYVDESATNSMWINTPRKETFSLNAWILQSPVLIFSSFHRCYHVPVSTKSVSAVKLGRRLLKDEKRLFFSFRLKKMFSLVDCLWQHFSLIVATSFAKTRGLTHHTVFCSDVPYSNFLDNSFKLIRPCNLIQCSIKPFGEVVFGPKNL